MANFTEMLDEVYEKISVNFKDEIIYCQGKNGVKTLVLFDEPELIPNKMSRYRIGTVTILVLKDNIPFLSVEVIFQGPTPPKTIAGVLPVNMITRSIVVNREGAKNLKYDLDELQNKMLLLIVVPDQSESVKEVQFVDLEEKFRGVLDLSQYSNVRDFAIAPLRKLIPTLDDLLKRNSINLPEININNDETAENPNTEDVLIVAAKTALREFFEHSAYICQPNRSFRPVNYLGFYSEGKINQNIPKILGQVEDVMLTKEGIQNTNLDKDTQNRLFKLIESLERVDERGRLGSNHKVFFLSSKDSKETLKLNNDIINDTTSIKGDIIAFTQSQRYVSLSKLKNNPKKTSDIV